LRRRRRRVHRRDHLVACDLGRAKHLAFLLGDGCEHMQCGPVRWEKLQQMKSTFPSISVRDESDVAAETTSRSQT
jgi:hypothetical protein